MKTKEEILKSKAGTYQFTNGWTFEDSQNLTQAILDAMEEYAEQFKTNKNVNDYNFIAAGLFDLDEFHGWPPKTVNNYFKDKGWIMVDCFNDYKWAWVNHSLNKSIVAKSEMVDKDALENEMIVDIWWYDGIYSES